METTLDFQVTLALDESANVRETADGYLVAEPRVARTGVQVYRGDELGKPEVPQIRLNRPETTVFDRQSLQSYTHRPITFNHPTVPVTADNWKQYAVGHTGGEVIRDGDHVRVPILLMDAGTIARVKSGEAKELSLGYQMAVDFDASGEGYDATVTNIRANHLAVVPVARGGPALSIGDQPQPGEQTQMTTASPSAPTLTALTVDGISVQVADQGAQIVQRHISGLETKLAAAATQNATDKDTIADLKKQVEAKDAEITTLKKSVDDAKLSPDKLQSLVADRALTERVATAILGTEDRKALETNAIKKAVVHKKLGDAAANWSDEQIAVSFATIATAVGDQTSAPTNQPSGRDYGASLMGADTGGDDDIETRLAKAHDARDAWLGDAYLDKSA